jgi:hypothetical protein
VTDLLDLLTAHGRSVLTAGRAKLCAASAERFAEALETIPDYPAAELSDEDFARVNAIAEQVIAAIEHRLEAPQLDDDTRDYLADLVYEVRRALEDAFHWRKHYLGT